MLMWPTVNMSFTPLVYMIKDLISLWLINNIYIYIYIYIYTWPAWQLLRRHLGAGPSVQEGVHELAVVLPMARLIPDVVEPPCGEEEGSRFMAVDKNPVTVKYAMKNGITNIV